MEVGKITNRLKKAVNPKLVAGVICATLVFSTLNTKKCFAAVGASKIICSEIMETVKKDPNPGIYSYLRGNSTVIVSGLVGVSVGLAIGYVGARISFLDELYNATIAVTALNARDKYLADLMSK
jgi:hypothetical protein